jgi:hypothetical protein
MSQLPESKTAINPGEVEKSQLYDGHGTEEDPFVVEFQRDDPENPMNWSQLRKWFVTTIVTLSVFAVTLTSSAYSVSANEVFQDFDISNEVFILGLSLFVLGFAIGPAVWGPLVRIYPSWLKYLFDHELTIYLFLVSIFARGEVDFHA